MAFPGRGTHASHYTRPNPKTARGNLKKLLPCLLCLTVAWGLSACSPRGLANRVIYRVNVQQGNLISQDMLSRLEYGMSKEKILQIMGHPVLRDPFHRDDWYYVYTHRDGWKIGEQRNIVLRFRDNRLLKVEGDVRLGSMDSESLAAQLEAAPRRSLVIPDAAPEGLLRRLFSGDSGPPVPGGEEEEKGSAAEAVTSEPSVEDAHH